MFTKIFYMAMFNLYRVVSIFTLVGFGDLEGNLWAGLDHLHAMTVDYAVEMHVYMDTFEGESAYAHYNGLVI